MSIKPSLPQKLKEAVAVHFPQGLPDVGYNYLNKLNIDKQLSQYLRFEEESVKREDLYILDVERTLHAVLMVNGVSCVLAGKADRIERRGHLIRIVDYKTGSVHDKDVKVPRAVDNISEIPEKALQLLIYKFLYLKEHPGVDPKDVTASIYGLRMPQVTFDLRVDVQQLNDRFMETMEGFLANLLAAILDPSIPFVQTLSENSNPCVYCDYKDLCLNTAKEASPEDGR